MMRGECAIAALPSTTSRRNVRRRTRLRRDGDGALERHVARRRTDVEAVGDRLERPRAGGHVPEREVDGAHIEGHGLRLAGLEVDAREALQIAHRTLDARSLVAHVELGDLVAG